MSRVLPTLFNTEMVWATLDGRKTAIRRICKDADDYNVPNMSFYDADKRTYAVHSYADKEHMDSLGLVERTCPICPGDILYVRETWCNANKAGVEPDYYYLADTCICEDYDKTEWKWHPSIHMPKEAARIWLKVTKVSVEKLQDMWASDTSKEGLIFTKPYTAEEMIQEFSKLWNSTIKKADLNRYGWEANPWVWVIEFERCDKPESERIGKRTNENEKMDKWLKGMRMIESEG